MNTDNNELRDFIRETLRQIQEGTIGHTNAGYVDFEIAIAKTTTASGQLGVTVLGIVKTGAEGELKRENISKVRFKTQLKGSASEMAPITWGNK